MIDVGLLVLRLVLGVIFIGHGAQKLSGSFGGPRISGFAKMLEQLGVKPVKPMAILAGVQPGACGDGLYTPDRRYGSLQPRQRAGHLLVGHTLCGLIHPTSLKSIRARMEET